MSIFSKSVHFCGSSEDKSGYLKILGLGTFIICVK